MRFTSTLVMLANLMVQCSSVCNDFCPKSKTLNHQRASLMVQLNVWQPNRQDSESEGRTRNLRAANAALLKTACSVDPVMK